MRNATKNLALDKYYQHFADYSINMETIVDSPMFLTLPYLGRMDTSYINNFEMPTYKKDVHDPWIQVQPLLGRTVNTSKTYQYTFRLTKNMFNSGYWDGVFNRSNEVYWPVAWMSEQLFFDKETANDLHDKIEGLRERTKQFQYSMLSICSFLLAVLWVAWFRFEWYGSKRIKKDEKLSQDGIQRDEFAASSLRRGKNDFGSKLGKTGIINSEVESSVMTAAPRNPQALKQLMSAEQSTNAGTAVEMSDLVSLSDRKKGLRI